MQRRLGKFVWKHSENRPGVKECRASPGLWAVGQAADQRAPAGRRSCQTGGSPGEGLGWEGRPSSAGRALRPLTHFSAPLPTLMPCGQRGCGLRSIKCPRQSPCETSLPDAPVQGHQRPYVNSCSDHPTTGLSRAEWNIGLESGQRMGRPKAGTFNQTGKRAQPCPLALPELTRPAVSCRYVICVAVSPWLSGCGQLAPRGVSNRTEWGQNEDWMMPVA